MELGYLFGRFLPYILSKAVSPLRYKPSSLNIASASRTIYHRTFSSTTNPSPSGIRLPMNPFTFDFVMCRDGIVELTRYRLDFVSSSSATSDKPTEVPGDLTKIITFRVPEDDGYLEEYRVANDHIVMYWSAPTGLNIQTAPIKTNETVASGLEPRTAIYEMRMVERYLSALCSASGRLCYLVEPDLIEIVDFLPNGNQQSTGII